MKRFAYMACSCLFVALTLFLGGCVIPPKTAGDNTGFVTLWVTRDFGTETIFHSELPITPNQSVLALLQKHLEVETEYGGGFVNSINGLQSGYSQKKDEDRRMVDWFYYVNGILSDQGAALYVPVDGDIIWWDYRPWGEVSFTPAVVGAFPQPFSGGYRGKQPGTLILAGDACREEAELLARFLNEMGVASVEVAPYQEEKAVNRTQIVLVVALWQELHQSSFWEGVQNHRDRTGWFAELTPERFYPLDQHALRQNEGYGENTGAVMATGTGLGDPYPLWLVTATDLEGLAETVDALVKKRGQFEKAVGALVLDGEVLVLPANSRR